MKNIFNKIKNITFVLIAGFVFLTAIPTTALAVAISFDAVSIGSQTGTLRSGIAGSSTYLVTVTRSGSGSLSVSLGLSTPLPAGVTASFSPTSVSFSGNSPTTATSILTLTATATSSATTTNFTVLGTAGAVTHTAIGSLTIAPPDLTAPVITLNGTTPITLEAGSTYIDAGAVVTDNVDPTTTASSTGSVNTSVVGVYTITYTATDTSGNIATPVTRTVNVVDTTAPSIAPQSDITLEAISPTGATGIFTNPTATDIVDGSLSTVCTPISGSTFALGSTTVSCSVTDANSNTATSSFMVTVVDTTAPTVTVTGANPMNVPVFTAYTELGATATDIVDGSLTATSTGSVNTSVLGAYTITYTATDTSGNTGTTTRTVNVVDVTAPVVDTNSNISLEASGPAGTVVTFTSPIAVDDVDATSTATCLPASGSLFALGTTTVTCSATDTSGNTGNSTFTVTTIDSVAPVITINGTDPVTVEGGSVYTDAGATALDNINGDISGSIVTTNPVNTSVVGTYTVSYDVVDSSGNAATTTTRTVNVVDTTAPVIVLTGANPDTVEGTASASSYVDPGATATDNVSAPVTVLATGTVNTHVVGSYTITYTATDASGNSAATTTRTVNVVDTTAPIINVTGANPIIFTINNPYTELGATAADLIDGAITTNVSGTVDTATLGTYTITYTATDVAGNNATATRSVIVIPPDTTAPVITLLGTTPITVEGGSVYTDAGATALDNVNGNMTASIVTVNPVNTMVVAPYIVTYNVTDGAGNPATEVTRVVNVVDTTAPVITLIGGNMSLHTGDTFTDPGSIVTDNVDATSTATVTGTVNTSATSTTVLIYDAVDANGNHAIPVTRTVTVVDVSVPIITLLGNSSVTVEVDSVYTDAGATSTDDVDGDISANIVVGGVVNTAVLGDYTLTYDVSDSSGNSATQISRLVHVVDTTAPVVTLNGSSTVNLIVGDTYTEDGATATDNYDVASPSVSITGSVDTNTAGTYTLTYTATDTSGNTGTTTRTVVVSAVPDVVAPIITLLGSNPVTVTVGGTFTDAGATALDNVDATTTVDVSGSVDTSTIGTYTLTYNAVDTAGNHAVSVTRTINVVAAESNPSGARTGGSSAPSSGGGNVLGASTSGTTTVGTTGEVLGAETFIFTKNLRRGMRNSDVTELQKRLVSEGFLKVAPTGYFGPLTFAAVKAYQTAHSIKPVSGFVGPLTRAELNK